MTQGSAAGCGLPVVWETGRSEMHFAEEEKKIQKHLWVQMIGELRDKKSYKEKSWGG